MDSGASFPIGLLQIKTLSRPYMAVHIPFRILKIRIKAREGLRLLQPPQALLKEFRYTVSSPPAHTPGC